MADSHGPLSRKHFLMLKELVDRELHYLKCLQALLYLILQPLKDASLIGKPIISNADIEKIFSNNLNSFLSISQALFFELLHLQERAEEDPSCVKEVGLIFQKQGDLLKCYYGYAPQVHAQIPFINELTKKNAKWDAFLKEKYLLLRSKNIHDDFVSLLVRPSRQAVLYLQFLEGFVKEFGDVEPLTSGLAKVKEVLAHVGKSVSKDQPQDPEVQKLHSLQKRIIGRIRIAEQGRVLVLQEQFVVLEEKRKKEVHLVLFNDALFIGAPYDDKILLERFLPLSLVSMTAEEVAEKPVLKLSVFGYTYMLLASSHRSRVNWLTKLAEIATAQKQQQHEDAQAKAAVRKSRAYSRAELISEFTSVVVDYPRMLIQLVGKLNPKTKAFEEPQGTNATYVVNKHGAIIGRDLEANERKALILITDDDNISRRKPGRAGHAEIDFKEEFRLWDLGSSNNTFILDGSGSGKVVRKLSAQDGTVTTDPYALKEGTLFQLGGTRFRVIRVELSPLDAKNNAAGNEDDDQSWASALSPSSRERATDSPARALSPGRSKSPPKEGSPMLRRAVSVTMSNAAAVEKTTLSSPSSVATSNTAVNKPLLRGNSTKMVSPRSIDSNVGMRTIRASPNALGLMFANALAADDESADSVADLLISKAQEKEKNRKKVLFDSDPLAAELAALAPTVPESSGVSPSPSSEGTLNGSQVSSTSSTPTLITSSSEDSAASSPVVTSSGDNQRSGSWLASEKIPIPNAAVPSISSSQTLAPVALGSARAGGGMRASFGPDDLRSLSDSPAAGNSSSAPSNSAPLRSSLKKVPSAAPPPPPPGSSAANVASIVSGATGGSGVSRSPRSTRVLQVLVKDNIAEAPSVRGRVSLNERSTIMNLRSEIHDSLLEDAERQKLKGGAENLSLKIGGKVPLRPQQNSQLAMSLITAEDSELLVELTVA